MRSHPGAGAGASERSSAEALFRVKRSGFRVRVEAACESGLKRFNRGERRFPRGPLDRPRGASRPCRLMQGRTRVTRASGRVRTRAQSRQRSPKAPPIGATPPGSIDFGGIFPARSPFLPVSLPFGRAASRESRRRLRADDLQGELGEIPRASRSFEAGRIRPAPLQRPQSRGHRARPRPRGCPSFIGIMGLTRADTTAACRSLKPRTRRDASGRELPSRSGPHRSGLARTPAAWTRGAARHLRLHQTRDSSAGSLAQHICAAQEQTS